MAFSMALSVRISRVVMPRLSSSLTARADWREISNQTSCPDGASAECGSARPSASATTCEVPADARPE